MMGFVRTIILVLLSFKADAYILFSDSAIRQCSLRDVKKSEFRVCLTGSATAPDFERNREYIKRATFTWLRVYKQIDFSVTSKVVFSCESPSLKVNFLRGSGRSYAQPGQTWIYQSAGFGTYSHELGHALAGLSDTYVGSSACQCKSGHPYSLMCCGQYSNREDYSVFSTLFDDDVKGAVAAFRKLFGSETMPSMKDNDWSVFKSFDLSNPYHGIFDENSEEMILREDDHQVFITDGPLTPIDEKALFD